MSRRGFFRSNSSTGDNEEENIYGTSGGSGARRTPDLLHSSMRDHGRRTTNFSSRRSLSMDEDNVSEQIASGRRHMPDKFHDGMEGIDERSSNSFRRRVNQIQPQLVAALQDIEKHDVVQSAIDKMHRAYSYVEPVTGKILSRVGSLDDNSSLNNDIEFVIPHHQPFSSRRSSSLARSPSLSRVSPTSFYGMGNHPRLNSNTVDLIDYHRSQTPPPLIRIEAPSSLEGSRAYSSSLHADQISINSDRGNYDKQHSSSFYKSSPYNFIPSPKKSRFSAAATDFRRFSPDYQDPLQNDLNMQLNAKFGTTFDASRLKGRRKLPQVPFSSKTQNSKLAQHSSNNSSLDDNKASRISNNRDCNDTNDRTRIDANDIEVSVSTSSKNPPIRRQPSKLLRQTSVDIAEGNKDHQNEPLLTKSKSLRIEKVKKLSEKEVKEDYLRDKLDSVVCVNGKTYVVPQCSVENSSRQKSEDDCYGGASQFFENSTSFDWHDAVPKGIFVVLITILYFL